jgi:hypothetical protein
MAARATWETFSVLANSRRNPPPHPALDPDAPTALCTQTDPDVFFPGEAGSTRHAAAACLACELRTACFEWALPVTDLVGYWGGSTERQRERERARRASRTATSAAEPIPERRAA